MMELLPCPHCDGPAELSGPDNPASEYWVRCTRNCCDGTMNKDRAIDRWNTRAGHDTLIAQRDALTRIVLLMADKLEAHGEVFNQAEFDAALAAGGDK